MYWLIPLKCTITTTDTGIINVARTMWTAFPLAITHLTHTLEQMVHREVQCLIHFDQLLSQLTLQSLTFLFQSYSTLLSTFHISSPSASVTCVSITFFFSHFLRNHSKDGIYFFLLLPVIHLLYSSHSISRNHGKRQFIS